MFRVHPATSFQELYAAFRLVHDQYCKVGYMTEKRSKLRFFLRDLLPTATAFVAMTDEKVIGTATGIRLGLADLPSSELFAEEILELLRAGRAPGEGTKFACTQCHETEARGIGRMSAVGTEILRWLFYWCYAHEVSDWLIVVHPRVKELYVEGLGFQMLGSEKAVSYVSNSPGILLRLDIKAVLQGNPREMAKEVFLKRPLDRSAYEDAYALNDEDIALLLLDDIEVLEQGTISELQALYKFHPFLSRLSAHQISRSETASQLTSRPLLFPSFQPAYKKKSTDLNEEKAPGPMHFALRTHFAAITAVLEMKAARYQTFFRCVIADDVPDSLIADPDLTGQAFVAIVNETIEFAHPGDSIVTYISVGIEHDERIDIVFSITSPHPSISTECREIVTAVGGTVLSPYETISGPCLSYTLPMVAFERVLPTTYHAIEKEGFALQTKNMVQGLRVLLVEDNIINQVLVKRLLTQWGHKVYMARDGLEALKLYNEGLDLILMDIQLPHLDGFQVTSKIRAHECQTGYHIPIYAMTSFVMKDDRQRCLNANMDGYLPKPVAITALAELLHEIGLKRKSAEYIPTPKIIGL